MLFRARCVVHESMPWPPCLVDASTLNVSETTLTCADAPDPRRHFKAESASLQVGAILAGEFESRRGHHRVAECGRNAQESA